MIGRRSRKPESEDVEKPKSFDDYALRLGDIMRGERATMGKSLLDVQRELRIKAAYIAAIENCDPDAFETPGFIAGYVRSYARYLDMDPDATYGQFCAESGFATAHGMDETAKSSRSGADAGIVVTGASKAASDPFINPSLPFTPKEDGFFSRMEPGAVGSVAVLVALVCALGYGGWSVLQEVQRVQVAPVERTPVVLSEIDPLNGAAAPAPANNPANNIVTAAPQNAGVDGLAAARTGGAGVFTPPQSDGLDRLYRPQALDVPVLIARDAPISTLDTSTYSAFPEANFDAPANIAQAAQAGGLGAGGLENEIDALIASALGVSGVQVVAVRPAWVRIKDASGGVLFTGIMTAGDTYDVPADAEAPAIEVGESGAVYFAVNGETLGPAGPRGTVTKDLALAANALVETLPSADVQADSDLKTVLADLGTTVDGVAPIPQVIDSSDKRIYVVAAREAWVRVRSNTGTVLYEGVMGAGDFYAVPAIEEAPTIRTGDAGAIYFAAASEIFGPYGGNGSVQDNLALSVDKISSDLTVAELPSDSPVARTVAELRARPAAVSGTGLGSGLGTGSE